MVDVLTQAQRAFNMSMIRGRDTKPELLIRRALHARGFRYRLHSGGLPGRPDIVLPRYRTVIFVHGCFWHVHNCHLAKKPNTHAAFWEEKLSSNRARDQRTLDLLKEAGWRVAVVWECSVRGRSRQGVDGVIAKLERYIKGKTRQPIDIAGRQQA